MFKIYTFLCNLPDHVQAPVDWSERSIQTPTQCNTLPYSFGGLLHTSAIIGAHAACFWGLGVLCTDYVHCTPRLCDVYIYRRKILGIASIVCASAAAVETLLL